MNEQVKKLVDATMESIYFKDPLFQKYLRDILTKLAKDITALSKPSIPCVCAKLKYIKLPVYFELCDDELDYLIRNEDGVCIAQVEAMDRIYGLSLAKEICHVLNSIHGEPRGE